MTEANNYRYERKFVFRNLNTRDLKTALSHHKLFFKSIYHPRTINNIYFDTWNLSHYFDNTDGLGEREKYRIRWYGDLLGQIEKPTLEIKIKHGFLGDKKSYRLSPMELKADFNHQAIQDCLESSNLPAPLLDKMKSQHPTLINRYQREYLLSDDKTFRVTIDTDLEFYSPTHGFLRRAKGEISDLTILEIKYSDKDAYKEEAIGRGLPVTLGKFSKYVYGVDALEFGA